MDLDKKISQKLRKEYEIERAAHSPSGKLSASQLGQPLLEQVLKIIGVPPKPVDDYALRLFKRGKQVEEWICQMLDGDDQVEVDYKGTIGIVDKVQDGVPIEIKSIKSSAFKWIKQDGAKLSHKLQVGQNALGLGSDKAKLIYVVADDFRVIEYDLQTADLKPAVEKIMGEVKTALKAGVLPPFSPREDWHAQDTYQKYTNYPEWISLDPETAMTKLKNQYKDAYKRLKELSK